MPTHTLELDPTDALCCAIVATCSAGLVGIRRRLADSTKPSSSLP